MKLIILQIALPCPLRLSFDYLANSSKITWQTGLRVKVPFGNRELIGIIVNLKTADKESDTVKLKTIIEAIDQQPIVSTELLSLTQWLSDYYHHPIGDCFQAVLPKKIRLGETADLETELYWQLTSKLIDIKLGKKQQQLITLLKDYSAGASQKFIYQKIGTCRTSLQGLEEKKIIRSFSAIKQAATSDDKAEHCQLNEEQQTAVEVVKQKCICSLLKIWWLLANKF